MDWSKPAPPVSFPLTSLEQLENQSLFTSFHFPFLKCSVPLQQKTRVNKSKLLVCHDMRGGYQDDRFVQGDNNPKAYSLWHWQCVDIFVYFSHSLITIPPPCWMNAAHSHGVKVLGTLITEHERGADICKVLLETKDSARKYALRLAEIAQKLGFDGWLLNIENVIALEQIPTLESFIRELTMIMHELVPGSLIIWYDAVTVDGELDWQNKLNKKNKFFFDACDGLFVNYTWKKEYPIQSAKLAGDRAGDVYMGVDVFGRNTFGGGGYKSDAALRVALESGVSAALFAPGWVYETNQGPTFEDAQTKFWASIHNVWPVAHDNPITLPLFTDFSQGFGTAIYSNSVKISDRAWSNISFQTLQPLLNGVLDSTFEVSVRSGSPLYSGGSALRFMGKLGATEVRATQIYSANISLTKTTLVLEFSVFRETIRCEFYVVIRMEDSAGVHLLFFSSLPTSDSSSWSVSTAEIAVETGSVITGIFGLSSLAPPDLSTITNMVLAQGSNVTDEQRKGASSLEPYEVHLGHLRILDTREDSLQMGGVSSFEGGDVEWSTNSNGDKVLSINLTWKQSEGGGGGDYSRYNIFVQQFGKPEYIGTAFVHAFYVDQLLVEDGAANLQFRLQPCNVAGYTQRLEESPVFLVHVP